MGKPTKNRSDYKELLKTRCGMHIFNKRWEMLDKLTKSTPWLLHEILDISETTTPSGNSILLYRGILEMLIDYCDGESYILDYIDKSTIQNHELCLVKSLDADYIYRLRTAAAARHLLWRSGATVAGLDAVAQEKCGNSRLGTTWPATDFWQCSGSGLVAP